jgi:hypothetical protein
MLLWRVQRRLAKHRLSQQSANHLHQLNVLSAWKTQQNFDSHILMLCNFKRAPLTPKAWEKYHSSHLFAHLFGFGQIASLSAKFVAEK